MCQHRVFYASKQNVGNAAFYIADALLQHTARCFQPHAVPQRENDRHTATATASGNLVAKWWTRLDSRQQMPQHTHTECYTHAQRVCVTVQKILCTHTQCLMCKHKMLYARHKQSYVQTQNALCKHRMFHV